MLVAGAGESDTGVPAAAAVAESLDDVEDESTVPAARLRAPPHPPPLNPNGLAAGLRPEVTDVATTAAGAGAAIESEAGAEAEAGAGGGSVVEAAE